MQRKEHDLSIVISPKEIFVSIRRNLHHISVAKLLRLSIERFRILLCSDAVHDLYMMCARARVRVLQIRLNRRGLTLMVPDRKRILKIRFLMLSEGKYIH